MRRIKRTGTQRANPTMPIYYIDRLLHLLSMPCLVDPYSRNYPRTTATTRHIYASQAVFIVAVSICTLSALPGHLFSPDLGTKLSHLGLSVPSANEQPESYAVPHIREDENLMKTGQETAGCNSAGIVSSYSTPFCARIAGSVSHTEEVPLDLC